MFFKTLTFLLSANFKSILIIFLHNKSVQVTQRKKKATPKRNTYPKWKVMVKNEARPYFKFFPQKHHLPAALLAHHLFSLSTASREDTADKPALCPNAGHDSTRLVTKYITKFTEWLPSLKNTLISKECRSPSNFQTLISIRSQQSFKMQHMVNSDKQVPAGGTNRIGMYLPSWEGTEMERHGGIYWIMNSGPAYHVKRWKARQLY